MARKQLSKRVKQTNLRMPEDFRQRLAREADKHRVSFNREILNRLHLSFDLDNQRTIAGVVNDLNIANARLRPILHDLHRQADLVRRVEALLAQLDQSPIDNDPTKVAADRVREIVAMIRADAHGRPFSVPIDD